MQRSMQEAIEKSVQWAENLSLKFDPSKTKAMIIHRREKDINGMYPANLKIEPGEELQSWGSFREDTLPIIKIAELAPNAQMIIDRVGW